MLNTLKTSQARRTRHDGLDSEPCAGLGRGACPGAYRIAAASGRADLLVPSGEVKKVNHGSLLNCGTDPGDATKRSHDDVCSSGVRGTSLFDHEASSKVQSDNAELAEGKVSKKSGAGGSGKSSKSLRGTDYKSKSMETNYRLTKNWRGKGKKSKDSSAQLREADPQAVSASRK